MNWQYFRFPAEFLAKLRYCVAAPSTAFPKFIKQGGKGAKYCVSAMTSIAENSAQYYYVLIFRAATADPRDSRIDGDRNAENVGCVTASLTQQHPGNGALHFVNAPYENKVLHFITSAFLKICARGLS